MAGRRGRSTCHGHQQCRCWATRRRGAAQGGVLVGFIGCTPSISPPSPRKSRPFAAAAAAPLATVSAPLAAGEQLILEGVDALAAAGGDGIVDIDLAAAAGRRRPRCEPHCSVQAGRRCFVGRQLPRVRQQELLRCHRAFWCSGPLQYAQHRTERRNSGLRARNSDVRRS